MKKTLAIVLTLLLSSFSLIGCADETGSSEKTSSGPGEVSSGAASSEKDDSGKASSEETAAGDTEMEITYWTIAGNRPAHIETAIEMYKDVEPGIKVNLVVNATDDQKKNLKISAASNSMPSMWFNWGGSLGSFYPENGISYNLNDYAESHGFSDMYNADAIEMCTFDGQLSGVPEAMAMFGVFYSKPMFEKAGITTLPATHEEFEDVLAKLKESGVIPIASGGKSGWQPFRLVEFLMEKNLGAEKHDQLLNMDSEIWLDDGITQSFQEFKSYVDAGYFPEGFVTQDPADSKNLVYNGLAAILIDGPSIESLVHADGQNPDDYDWFSLPLSDTTNRMTSFVQMAQFSSQLTEEELDAAIKFQQFCFSPEVIAAAGPTVPQYVPRNDNVLGEDMKMIDKMVEALDENGGFLITDQALPQEVVARMFEVQDAVIAGQMTPEEVGPAMKEFCDNYIAANS